MNQDEGINNVCDLQIAIHTQNYKYNMCVYCEPKVINLITIVENTIIAGLDFIQYQSMQGIRTKIWNAVLSGFAKPIGNDIIEIPKEKLVPRNAKNPKHSTFKLSGKWNMSEDNLVESYIELVNPERLKYYDIELYEILISLHRGYGVSFSLKDFTGFGFKELHFF